jgi:hypothetical protein
VHRQHAVVQLGADVAGVDVARQGHREVEAADPAGAPVQDALALLLLDVAGDRQPAVVELDVDVLARHAGQVELDGVGVVGLLDVGQG